MAIPFRYKNVRNPVAVTPEVIQGGMAHWADHCATCHANNGSGDTMYGGTMYPRPPDMRQKDTQEMSDGELYYTSIGAGGDRYPVADGVEDVLTVLQR